MGMGATEVTGTVVGAADVVPDRVGDTAGVARVGVGTGSAYGCSGGRSCQHTVGGRSADSAVRGLGGSRSLTGLCCLSWLALRSVLDGGGRRGLLLIVRVCQEVVAYIMWVHVGFDVTFLAAECATN